MNEIVKFDTSFGEVTLSPEVVKNYLSRGNTALTEQEIVLFINLCKYQGLNPFVGEAYAIKFGNDFQMVVGYDTYKRRAEEHPEYRGRKSGIVVMRNNDISKREGACLYPGDTLVGGWCTVYRDRGNRMEETYAEVSQSEYAKYNREGKLQQNWASKPATMIRKVAVSQALRDAFPTQYTGLYSEYDMPQGQDGNSGNSDSPDSPNVIDGAEPCTKEERQELFKAATDLFGENGVQILKKELDRIGLESTQQLNKGQLRQMIKTLNTRAEGVQPTPEQTPDPDYPFNGDNELA